MFFRHFFLCFFVLASASASLNWLFDPYDIYESPLIERINTHKSSGAPRFFKPLQVSARQPDVVFIGSSRVQVGLDPEFIPNSYNFGIPGIKATELLGYGTHILNDTGARQLIIGLDFFTFDDSQSVEGSYGLAVLGKNALLRALPETLLSFNALNLSRKTLKKSYKRKPVYHRKDGLYLMKNPPGRIAKDAVLESVKQFTKPGGSYNGLMPMDRSLDQLEQLLIAANHKGVKTVLFISPTHAALMEALDMTHLWETYENWKRRLSTITTNHKASLWDFGGYTALSTVPLEHSQSAFIDGGHYLPSIGNHLLEVINNNPSSPDFGRRLTPKNIEQELKQQREFRSRYRKANTDDVARIQFAVCSNDRPQIRNNLSCQ